MIRVIPLFLFAYFSLNLVNGDLPAKDDHPRLFVLLVEYERQNVWERVSLLFLDND
jgi:hypothetical protein